MTIPNNIRRDTQVYSIYESNLLGLSITYTTHNLNSNVKPDKKTINFENSLRFEYTITGTSSKVYIQSPRIRMNDGQSISEWG